MLARWVLAGLLGAAVLAACSGSHHGVAEDGSATPPSTAATTATVAPTTGPPTTGAATTAPPTTVALIPQETPDLAAEQLLTAWRNGDRASALAVAVPSAVASLFANPPQSFEDRGCQVPQNGMSNCAYGLGDDAGIAQIDTVSLDGGFVVQSVTVLSND